MSEITNRLPHMRGIKQAIEELKASDADTALTEKALRRLVLTGEIPSVRAGTKYLVNMDILIDYLYKGTRQETQQAQAKARVYSNAAGIRPVAE